MATKPKALRKKLKGVDKHSRVEKKVQEASDLTGGIWGGLPSNMATFEPKVVTRPKKGKVSGKGKTHLAADGGTTLDGRETIVRRLNMPQAMHADAKFEKVSRKEESLYNRHLNKTQFRNQ